jgi:hypothetical protein
MGSLRDRLQWMEGQGAVADGPRRYLMMRPDVLMGAVALLDDGARDALLQAWAASTREHGGASLRAYADPVGGDADALMATTAAAAADLGWGRWTWQRSSAGLALEVANSPFVDGWRAAAAHASLQPVCAPLRGMFSALLDVLQPDATPVNEVWCAAMHDHPDRPCRFEAKGSP